jgi:carbon-monoxide dehydrogenase large subunit
VPYVESSIGTPVEAAQLKVRPEGRVELVIGTQPSGQGHETSFAQVAADELGLEVGQVEVLIGDTDIVRSGGGSHSGRSMRLGGLAIGKAGGLLTGLGRRLAAHLLEAAETDLEFADGRFRIAGTDRGLDWFQLAAEAGHADLPEALAAELKDGLAVAAQIEFHTPVFPNGCHVAEVEVDPETGAVRLDRYTAVDDVGRVINPMIVEGQAHGGIAQGLGQALFEACVFDAAGQPLSGSLMDYALPRAGDLPGFLTAAHEVPSPTNPLGVKAAGEAGTTPALAAAVNAIVDALADLGVRDLAMPATPHRVWQAIRAARRAAPE